MKFAFVILNYNLVETTIDCIESIQKCAKKHDYMIIVVDNHSPNGAGVELAEIFKECSDVIVLINEANLGFAKGNNIGIKLAVEKGADFVICLNNDTVLLQDDFCDILIKEYYKKPVAVIGPRILLRNGQECHINGKLEPVQYYKEALENIGRHNSNPGIKKKNTAVTYLKTYLKKSKTVTFIYDRYIKKLLGKHSRYYSRTYDVILHGCCLIFTPVFFTKLTGFNPDTFMFREEELLYAQLKINGMQTLYSPKLKIRHLEDVSTDTVVRTGEEKVKFLNKYQKHSLRVLINYLELHKDKLYAE